MAHESGSGSGLDDLSQRAYEIASRRQAAALEVVAMLEDEYETWFESSAATLLRAGAWLAGTSLFRSFHMAAKAAPGTPVLSDIANEQGPQLLKVFTYLAGKDGIQLAASDLAVRIPPEHQPKKTILDVQARFQDRYNGIMKAHEFNYEEGGRTGAVACARLVKLHCLNRKDLEPAVAASIVSMGFVEGTKTAPARLGDRAK